MSSIHRAADHPTGVRPAFVGREVQRYTPRRRAPRRHTPAHRPTLFRDGLLALVIIGAGLALIFWAALGLQP